MDVNDIGKTRNMTDFSAYNEQQKQTAIEQGRYIQQSEPKDYSKYFKIIIALLLLPYIGKLIEFIILVVTYKNFTDIINRMLNL